MKITIITATFNSGETLRDTIESVLSQTYPDLEYIIIDGGSKDDTIDIVREFEPKFNGRMRWISERDKGIYDAMNKGIRMASGDIIGILNSDDLFMNKYVIENIVNTFTNEVDAVFSNLYFVKWNDTNKVVRRWKGSPYISFSKGWHPAHPTFYVKRKVYEKYGVFDLSFAVSADFELMLRFIEKYKIKTKYLDKYTIKMRIGGESTGSIKKIIKGNANIIRAFKKNSIHIPILYPMYRLTPKVIDMVMYKTGLRREKHVKLK